MYRSGAGKITARAAAVIVLAMAVPVAVPIAAPAPASAADPRAPAGQDPGGTALALIGGGIDYMSARIALRLARDGEGEMIAWDFVDNDQTPYVAPSTEAEAGAGAAPSADRASETVAPEGNRVAEAMLTAYARGRLVPVRVPEGNPQSLARAIAFAVGTPAEIIAIAAPVTDPAMREVVRQAANRFKDHLFVVAAAPIEPGTGAGPTSAGGLLNLANVLVVTSAPEVKGRNATLVSSLVDLIVVPRGSTMFGSAPDAAPRDAFEAVAMAAASAACQRHGADTMRGSAVKAATFDASRPIEGSGGVRVLDPICFYGGKRL